MILLRLGQAHFCKILVLIHGKLEKGGIDMQIIACTFAEHADVILEIFNDAIATTTALYAYQPRTKEFMSDWFEAKEKQSFPVIGCQDGAGHLAGFASYGHFRQWPGYKYTIENSVYVHRDFRGRGVGMFLMQALIARAVEQEFHTMVAGIDAKNSASIALHKKLGFFHCGTIQHAGYKFSTWRDLAFYQLLLATPANPLEG